MRRGAKRRVLGGVAALFLGACHGDVADDGGLVLLGFQQAGGTGVLLNEPLVFYFSKELDPASVTPSTARVLDRAGRLVAGSFHVEEQRLVFEPRLALLETLEDGGFRPGERVSVELSGFPVPSGLRSLGGELLRESFSASFETVRLHGAGATFLDGSPDAAYPLLLASTTIGAREPLVLLCSEAIDPSSLHAEAFQLRRYRAGGEFEEIPIGVELVENTMQSGARLELRPLRGDGSEAPRSLEPGDYHLWVHEDARAPLDLGGHPVRSSWGVTQLPAVVTVELRPDVAGNRSQRVDFLGREFASPAEVVGVDGTARWDGSGRIALWLPAAAGDGSAGELVGTADELVAELTAGSGELAAARLELGEGERLDLSALRGPLVMRSQTSVHLDGELVRGSHDARLARETGEAWESWFSRVSTAFRLEGIMGAGTFEEWLAGQREAGGELTAIVAGGDLWIDGDVTLEGPLVLAAGGRVRVTGRVEAQEVWVLGPGGGTDIHPSARQSSLRLTPMGVNRLKRPLSLGALSAPIRPDGGKPSWSSARVGASRGAGSVHVRFLGEQERADGSVETVGPVDDAAVLGRCDAVRIWIELEIKPGVEWDPPMLDFVDLRWTEETDL